MSNTFKNLRNGSEEPTIMELSELENAAISFVDQAYKAAEAAKPNSTDLEVEGMAIRLILNTFNFYRNALNEQIQASSTEQSTKGTQGEPGEVQADGTDGRTEEGSEGIREESNSTSTSTRNKKKKRRGQKS